VSKTFEIGFRGNASERLRWRAARVPQHVVRRHSVQSRPMPCRDISPTSGRRGGKASNSASMAMPAVSTMRWARVGWRPVFSRRLRCRTARTAYASRPTVRATVARGYRAAGRQDSRHPGAYAEIAPGLCDDAANAREGDDPGAGPAVRARRRKQPGRQRPRAGIATVKLDASHRSTRNSKSFGGVTNLFNTRYATFGTLGSNNLLSGIGGAVSRHRRAAHHLCRRAGRCFKQFESRLKARARAARTRRTSPARPGPAARPHAEHAHARPAAPSDAAPRCARGKRIGDKRAMAMLGMRFRAHESRRPFGAEGDQARERILKFHRRPCGPHSRDARQSSSAACRRIAARPAHAAQWPALPHVLDRVGLQLRDRAPYARICGLRRERGLGAHVDQAFDACAFKQGREIVDRPIAMTYRVQSRHAAITPTERRDWMDLSTALAS